MIVFKYLHEDRVDVLKNQLIRFTQPGNFNDPFEAMPNVESILPKGQASNILGNIIDMVPKDEMLEIYQNEIKKIIESENFTDEQIEQLQNINFEVALNLGLDLLNPTLDYTFDLEDENLRKTIPYKFRDGIDKSLGILSVSEVNNNILMWSHYANSHRGFVIAFDANHKFFDQRENSVDQARVLRRVSYKDKRPTMTLYDPELNEDEFINLFIENVILTKNKRWSYESEWRMAHTLNAADKCIRNGSELIYLFHFPLDSIKGIIFGSRMKDETKKEILNLIKSKDEMRGIKLFQAELDKENYEVNISDYID